MQASNISSIDDIQNLFKGTIAEFLENGLESAFDEELGYRKYDYKNEDTNNSRNDYSSKSLRTSFGNVDVSMLWDRKGEFESQILKKNQTSISQDPELHYSRTKKFQQICQLQGCKSSYGSFERGLCCC